MADNAYAGKAYLCMGQLDEADRQYRRAMELEPGSAAFKAEAQLVDIVRNNLKQGKQCLEEGDARHAPHPSHPCAHLLCVHTYTHTHTHVHIVPSCLAQVCHCVSWYQ